MGLGSDKELYFPRNLLKPPTTEHYFISASKQPLLSRKQCLEQRRLSASRCLQQSTSPTTEHHLSDRVYLHLSDRVYLKRWKDHDPDKGDARHNAVKEELESVKCYSIEFSGKLRSDTEGERSHGTAEKRNDLLGSEPTTEPVTSCLGVPVLSTQKPETKGPTTR